MIGVITCPGIAAAMLRYQSPCCDAPMPYMIAVDAYVCQKCKKEYDVLSVEKDHVGYIGGPPAEIPK